MSYETVVEQVKEVPEECLDKISDFIGYIMYRYKTDNLKKSSEEKNGGLAEFFGAIPIKEDPLKIQKEMRSEWN